jgi:hypothetical protein
MGIIKITKIKTNKIIGKEEENSLKKNSGLLSISADNLKKKNIKVNKKTKRIFLLIEDIKLTKEEE